MKLALKLSIPGILALSLCASTAVSAAEPAAEFDDTTDTRPIGAMAEVPPLVKATLDRELPGAALRTGSLAASGSGDVYDLDVVQMQQAWNVRIATSGDLIVKRRRG